MIESVTPGLLANTSLLEETIWIFPSHFQVPSATHVLGYGTSLACYCCIESATAKDYVLYLIYAVEMLCYPLENNISTQISNDNDRWSNIWSHVKYIASRKNQSDFLYSVILNSATFLDMASNMAHRNHHTISLRAGIRQQEMLPNQVTKELELDNYIWHNLLTNKVLLSHLWVGKNTFFVKSQTDLCLLASSHSTWHRTVRAQIHLNMSSLYHSKARLAQQLWYFHTQVRFSTRDQKRKENMQGCVNITMSNSSKFTCLYKSQAAHTDSAG